MRIAFLTNEFVTERNSRGLGTYLDRITRTLKEMGHEPEVFVRRADNPDPEVRDFNGIRVERVRVGRNPLMRGAAELERRLLKPPWGGSMDFLGTALDLAGALERRHAKRPFDVVQSTNCGASGLFVRRVPGRVHLIRLSSHLGLWWREDGKGGRGADLMIRLERACVNRADVAYAPSHYLAEYCRRTGWRRDVHVIRPPVFQEFRAVPDPGPDIPARYLIHFGQIGERKGSDVVARALERVWREVPDFTMIWAGNEIRRGSFEKWHGNWGRQARNVNWLGMISKDRLYALLKSAEAAVLPSRVDNLPNTVIESLMLGVPVIGSAGVSIDELVEPGRSGELVPVGDDAALADAMLRVWRRQAAWVRPGFRPPTILDEFSPERAASALLTLAMPSTSPRDG